MRVYIYIERERERPTYFTFFKHDNEHVNVKTFICPCNEPRQQFGNTGILRTAQLRSSKSTSYSYLVNLNVFWGPFVLYFFACKWMVLRGTYKLGR